MFLKAYLSLLEIQKPRENLRDWAVVPSLVDKSLIFLRIIPPGGQYLNIALVLQIIKYLAFYWRKYADWCILDWVCLPLQFQTLVV